MTEIAADGTKREIVLVMGMHRSGTSAFTRVCNLLGGALPGPLVEPAIGNELGHWEPAEVVAMNDRALLAAGGDVNSVFPVSEAWKGSAAGDRFVAEVQGYIQGLGDAPVTWFVKDPRISILADLWRRGVEQAGGDPKVVIVFRNPWEVAASLARRQLHHFPEEVWPLERGLALWLNYTLAAEKASRGLSRSFVSYHRLLRNWRGEMQRVYAQLALPYPAMGPEQDGAVDAFLRPEQRHARHEAAPKQDQLVGQVLHFLGDRLGDPDGGRADFNQAGERFVSSFDVLGGYLKAMEARIGEMGATRTRAACAEAEAVGLALDLSKAEQKAAQLLRRQDELERARTEGPDAEAAEALDRLKAKHAALSLAHADNLEAYHNDLDLLRTENEALKGAVGDVEAASGERTRVNERRLAALQAHLAAARIEQAIAAAALQGALNSDASSARALEQAQEALTEAHIAIDALRQSRSWRITRPIRGLTRLLGRR